MVDSDVHHKCLSGFVHRTCCERQINSELLWEAHDCNTLHVMYASSPIPGRDVVPCAYVASTGDVSADDLRLVLRRYPLVDVRPMMCPRGVRADSEADRENHEQAPGIIFQFIEKCDRGCARPTIILNGGLGRDRRTDELVYGLSIAWNPEWHGICDVGILGPGQLPQRYVASRPPISASNIKV